MRTPGSAALLLAALVGTTGCGSVTKIAHDGGGGAAGAHGDSSTDGGGGAAGAHGDSSTGTDAPRDLAADAPRDLAADAPRDLAGSKDRASASDVPRDRVSVPPKDAHPDGIVTGGQCQGDSDCKLYPAGVGECCGSCIPATEPQPPTVQCLIACLTPLKSCTCVSHQCKGSNTLL